MTRTPHSGLAVSSYAKAKEIDEKGYIDQHYYAIASKATITSATELPVPAANGSDPHAAEREAMWAAIKAWQNVSSGVA